jgi:hypothetical protein
MEEIVARYDDSLHTALSKAKSSEEFKELMAEAEKRWTSDIKEYWKTK